jgi:hypothetical protein
MKNAVLKLTEEIAEGMQKHFASADFQSQIKAIKEANSEDTGTFRMVISTDDVDRHGEIVVQEGIDSSRYMTNAIVLWGHDSYSPPVGITEKIVLERDGTKVKTIAEGKFAPTAFAQELRKLYEAKILNTSSIGFIPKEYEGNKITVCELLEWSFVSIPANPFAVAVRGLGLDMKELIAKGIFKDAQEGDDVETPAEETEKKEGEETESKPEEEKVEEPVVDTEAPATDEEAEEADDAIVDDEEKTLTVRLSNGTEKKFKLVNGVAVKAGRVLSKANLEKVKSAIDALEEVVKIAETTSEEDAGKAVDTDTPEDIDVDGKEAGDFLVLKRAMQSIATLTTEVLAEAKKSAKARGENVR